MTASADPAPTRPPGPIMSAAFAYQRAADRFSEWMGTISQYMVLVTVAVGFTNVVLRYFGRFTEQNLTSNALIEWQWYLYSLIFLFGFGYILKHQINVRVDFWFANRSGRTKAWIDFVGHLVSLVPFTVIAIWVSIPQVATSWRLNEQSPDPSGLPRAPIKTMIIVGFVLLLIQSIAEVIKLVAVLRGHQTYEEATTHEEPVRVE